METVAYALLIIHLSDDESHTNNSFSELSSLFGSHSCNKIQNSRIVLKWIDSIVNSSHNGDIKHVDVTNSKFDKCVYMWPRHFDEASILACMSEAIGQVFMLIIK